jgi:hypothetical protein
VLKIMGRYLADITAATAPQVRGVPASPWDHAASEAREAWQNAYCSLPVGGFINREQSQRGRPRPVTRELEAVANTMAVGRDLLHTHLATDPRGKIEYRTAWGLVLRSEPVNRALLAEISAWSRQIATHGTRLASAGPPLAARTPAQRSLTSVCHRLTAIVSAVDAAHRSQPITTADLRELHSVPLNAVPDRYRPAVAANVTGLCRGTYDRAERISRTAVPPEASESQVVTADSFRRVAAHATAISHHCQLSWQALATRAAQLGDSDLAANLQASAHAAGQARNAWHNAASAWYHAKTSDEGHLTPAAEETADLVRWTGRLAYFNPSWTPSTPSTFKPRPPERLAPTTHDIRQVAAAIRAASITLAALAAADHAQLRVSAQTGQLLAPVSEITPAGQTTVHFEPASADRIDRLLATYTEVTAASARAAQPTPAIGHAKTTGSQILTPPPSGWRSPARMHTWVCVTSRHLCLLW